MDLKKILLEVNLENVKKDLQNYLESTKEDEVYEFPYLPETYVVFTKRYLKDYGSILKLLIFRKDQKIGSVLIRKSGNVYIRNETDQTKKSLEKVPNPPQFFGKVLDVIK